MKNITLHVTFVKHPCLLAKKKQAYARHSAKESDVYVSVAQTLRPRMIGV